jgi:2,4-dienoyl-CoA reductase (NADPH2)
MSPPVYPNLFKPLTVNGIRLKNRLTMAPLYLGYAHLGGKISPVLLAHYQLMAQSGVALVVVENACIETRGSGSPRTIRCEHDRYLPGLSQLAGVIKERKSLAALQINHAGRFAGTPEPVSASDVPAFGRTPRPLTQKEIIAIQKKYARAALRVKQAGFDMVELHGGTGYLLAQFVSPRTNRRADGYGGTLENRMRFALETVQRVKDAVGDFPVGYRFLADEWLPDGLKPKESTILAKELARSQVAYISVMGGTYESFFLPEIIQKSRKPGYMVALARAVKKAVNVPVIAAGRISTPARAEAILAEGSADLIGLARMLWVDPQWPAKARAGLDGQIRKCSPKCDACMQLVIKGQPAVCPRWDKAKRSEYKEKLKA